MQLIVDLLVAQLLDPFRIGLILFLLLTTLRNQGATGRAIPLALGVVFVAVLIPTTFVSAAAPYWVQIAVGIVANLVWLGAMWLAYGLFLRFRGARA